MSDPLSGKDGIDRRTAIAGMIGGGLGALAPSGFGAEHPVERHLANPAAVDAARQTAAATDWTPAFLSAHQSETLEAVAERLLPGSTAARVNRFVDKLLALEPREKQRQFLESLSAFEGESLRQFARPFLRLTAEERDAVLASLDARPAKTEAPSSATDPDPFDHLKGWVSGAYYSSEIGMRELGWTGNVFFTGFPGCTHPDGHD